MKRKQFLITVLIITVVMFILIWYADRTNNLYLQDMISKFFGVIYIALFVVIKGIGVYLDKRRRKESFHP